MERIKKRSKLNDTVANPGPGLFLDKRARVSTARGYRVIRRFLRDEVGQELDLRWADARSHIRPTLLEIARWYWANRDYDHRTTFSDMKSDAERLRQQLRRLHTVMDALPRPVVHAINIQIARKVDGWPAVEDHFAGVRAASAMLKQASKSIAQRRNKKSGPASVENACAAIWVMWEAVTGRPFVRQWETGQTTARYAAERGDREFVGVDALFVQVTLRALDPETTVAQIRTGLKRVAAGKPKSG